MDTGRRITGTLLCRAGVDRLAFAAHDVGSIEAPGTFGGTVGHARQAFGGAAGCERILVAPSGEAVGVDALEIDAEPLQVLPPPALLGQLAGRSLRGFIQVRGELWPVMALARFGFYLTRATRETT